MDLFLIALLKKMKGLLMNSLMGSLLSLLLSDFLHKNICHAIVTFFEITGLQLL